MTPVHGSAPASAAGLVAEILEQAPGVQFLITSRERLNLPMEQIFHLDSLDFPEVVTADGRIGRPEEMAGDLSGYAAVQLFL